MKPTKKQLAAKYIAIPIIIALWIPVFIPALLVKAIYHLTEYIAEAYANLLNKAIHRLAKWSKPI